MCILHKPTNLPRKCEGVIIFSCQLQCYSQAVEDCLKNKDTVETTSLFLVFMQQEGKKCTELSLNPKKRRLRSEIYFSLSQTKVAGRIDGGLPILHKRNKDIVPARLGWSFPNDTSTAAVCCLILQLHNSFIPCSSVLLGWYILTQPYVTTTENHGVHCRAMHDS